MDFLKKANTTIKSAKELEKNLASVGITKKTFTGKKEEAGQPQNPSAQPVAAAATPAATAEVPKHIREAYEARKPEFEVQLAALKELAWTIALDSAAKNAHADQQAAKVASPDYVLDAIVKLQEYIGKYGNN